MEEVAIIQIIFFTLCLLSGIVIIIFVLRTNDSGLDYDKIIDEMKQETEDNLKELKEGNKKIDKIERKIWICKKKLGLKLTD